MVYFIVTLPRGRGAEYCDGCVGLFVCLSVVSVMHRPGVSPSVRPSVCLSRPFVLRRACGAYIQTDSVGDSTDAASVSVAVCGTNDRLHRVPGVGEWQEVRSSSPWVR